MPLLFCWYFLIPSSYHHDTLCYTSYAFVKVSLKSTNQTLNLRLSGWTSHTCLQYLLLPYLNTIFHALIAKDCHYLKHIFKYTGIRRLSYKVCCWHHIVTIRRQLTEYIKTPTLPHVNTFKPQIFQPYRYHDYSSF